VRMFGTVQDITERKTIELELRRSRENLARAQRTASLGSFERDLVTGEIEQSEELYRIHGVEPGSSQAELAFLYNLIHPEDRERVEEFRRQVVSGLTPPSIDYRIVRTDGIERTLHRTGYLLHDESGQPIRLAGTLQDITERKMIERELQLSRENLARAQRVAGVGSFERDLISGKWKRSDELYRIHGLTPDDPRATIEFLHSLVHPDDRAEFGQVNDLAAIGIAAPPLDFRIIRLDGVERILHRECEVACDANGTPLRLTATMQDITERRVAERRERQLERQLLHSQKLEALGTLAGGIAHDLNNTLVPIMALSKLTARGFQSGNPVRANLDIIFDASKRARDLVKRILAFSRKGEPEKKDTDLAAVLDEALKLLRASLPPPIQLETRIGEVPLLAADAAQIHQVVANLVTNAVQAIGEEKGTVRVLLDVVPGAADSSDIRLSVCDTGQGMDEATTHRIFEPFFTTKAVGQGTGLGLSIVHGIVTGHGGRVEVASEPGKGTRFDLYFPLARAEASLTSSRPAA
jgi:signal transduction histidine kinase